MSWEWNLQSISLFLLALLKIFQSAFSFAASHSTCSPRVSSVSSNELRKDLQMADRRNHHVGKGAGRILCRMDLLTSLLTLRDGVRP